MKRKSQSKRLRIRTPAHKWGKDEEVGTFAEIVKLFRQKKISEDEFRRFRLQNGAYGSRMQADYTMVRVKIPSGILTPEQLEKMAFVSDAFSIGSAHVSTRQNIQLHWVHLDDASEVLRSLVSVGLTTREACGNTIRNVVCSPYAGVCAKEVFDATPYANATAKFFLRNPMNQNLPRKFKFNFACCGEHSLVRIADIGLVPAVKQVNGREIRGFRIYLGGGLGPASFIAELLEEFTPFENTLQTCIAVVRLFDRLGDREKMHRNRMRYLVHDMGFEKFQKLVLKERMIVNATKSTSAKLVVEEEPEKPNMAPSIVSHESTSYPAGYQRWLRTNIAAQKQRGYVMVFIALQAGDITSRQLKAVADIVREFSAEGNIRTTPAQNIVLRWVLESDLPELYQKLVSAGLANPGALTIASAVGCTGTTSCNLAITNSHRLAKEIQAKFMELSLDLEDGLRDSTIKISGCPNSCGQHPVATVGFYGGATRVNNSLAPTYNMLLAGSTGENASLGKIFTRVPAKRVIDVLLKLFELYRQERNDGESFSEWVRRILRNEGTSIVRTAAELKKIVDEVSKLPSPEESPESYMDYGNDDKFLAKTARGECAA